VRFPTVLFFSAVWLMVVYVPVTHWVWGGGWLAQMGVRDFAGGIVVHVTAGISALVFAAMLGSRRGFPDQVRPPHNPGITMTGAAMLWVGWFGFNAGSALAADGNAGMAMLVTHVSAATASLAWAAVEWIRFGRPSLIGIVTGMVAGLATITPASGFVGPAGALIIGVVSGVVCQGMTVWIKQVVRIDDSLDVFAVHGVGGILGSLMVSFLASKSFQGLGLAPGMSIADHLWVQVVAVVSVAAWSALASFIIIKLAGAVFGLRVSDEDEIEGLDITAHGERSYDF
jgi:Amt family ammonium transporter